ncbi:elongation factor P hydroxylase [Marinobacter salinisoli]|uniref:Elongation factor P hydroxylase n=1 Tax=Marinobacter salinisoli TaxID=2769486 RepID=A0ABX7MMY9_9GAMM|nr:elongation factor P hydroxylase [Marinobacter salinisoli]QSP93586.1 elongation factor P hydroxylase [Marinobacter salinisoli]
MNLSPNDLIMLFNDVFRERYRTILVKGSYEPEYIPAQSPEAFARIVFAHGYFSSALHEISHWCIAGAHRRTLHDYGYWYCPDGRTAEQQHAFEQVEVKPQAIEWLFALAAGARFHISVDNLSGDGASDEAGFRQKVRAQAERYLFQGLPERANEFFNALQSFYGTRESIIKDWRQDADRIAPLTCASNFSRKIETV